MSLNISSANTKLSLLKGDDHAIHIVSERILGTNNTQLRNQIKYRGFILAESEQCELCIALWKRAMEVAINNFNSVVPVTGDLKAFVSLFGEMWQNGKLLRPKFIEDVFEKLVDANEN